VRYHAAGLFSRVQAVALMIEADCLQLQKVMRGPYAGWVQ
jgi:hypothetical protein